MADATAALGQNRSSSIGWLQPKAALRERQHSARSSQLNTPKKLETLPD